MKIVVDAMGGDYAPKSIVMGVVDAINEFGVKVALVGIEEKIKKELDFLKFPRDKVEIIHAPEVVEMTDPAIISIRKKKKSSISLGVKLLKEQRYNSFISAGNTGAVVAASTIFLGMIPRVERPAIGLVIPTLKGFAFLIDVGANAEAKPEHLLQSALMSEVYSKEVLGVDHPHVGLLNIGEESGKGGVFAKETYNLMAKNVSNFAGNVEPNDIFKGKFDCIICDGFVGNTIIKVSEGLMESAGTLLKREITKSPLALLGVFLMKTRLKHIKKMADYSEYGGAPLLGVNGIVMISHGRSSPKAIKNAIKATMKEIDHNIIDIMEKEIAN